VVSFGRFFLPLLAGGRSSDDRSFIVTSVEGGEEGGVKARSLIAERNVWIHKGYHGSMRLMLLIRSHCCDGSSYPIFLHFDRHCGLDPKGIER